MHSDGAALTLNSSEFRQISELAHERFGLDLKARQGGAGSGSAGQVTAQGGFKSFAEYYRHVLADTTGDALVGLIDSLTTNHTSFLREKAHFEFLARAARRNFERLPRCEIWSAACSSGEEPYTIAMCLSDTLARAGASRRGFRILATDISTRVLGIAQRGVYPHGALHDLPDPWRKAYLSARARANVKGSSSSSRSLASRIDFERLNLIQPFPHRKLFHVIFCRNVMMYFDKATQQDIVQRLSACLERGRLLVCRALRVAHRR